MHILLCLVTSALSKLGYVQYAHHLSTSFILCNSARVFWSCSTPFVWISTQLPDFNELFHARKLQKCSKNISSQKISNRTSLGHLQLLRCQQTIEDLHSAEVFHVLLNLPKLGQGFFYCGDSKPTQNVISSWVVYNYWTINMPFLHTLYRTTCNK